MDTALLVHVWCIAPTHNCTLACTLVLHQEYIKVLIEMALLAHAECSGSYLNSFCHIRSTLIREREEKNKRLY